MDSPYTVELKVAIAAVQQAARLSQIVLTAKDKGILQKEDLSPVTVADFAIQALLTASIHKAFPHDKFVGEEDSTDLKADPVLLERVWELLGTNGESPGPSISWSVPASKEQMCEMIDWCGSGIPGGTGSGRTWVFDPIDGTKTFVQGEMYAINIALLEDGKQVMSVVACPLLDPDAKYPISNGSVDPTGRGCILYAVKDHGAYVRPLPGSTAETVSRKLESHSASTSLSNLRSVTSTTVDSGIADIHQASSQKLGVSFPGCDLLGWVPRWASLALGLANMTIWIYKKRTRHAKIWDHAGAMLLFEEVGGKITDADGKSIDLSAGRKMTANYGFIAAPSNIHSEVLHAVRETLQDQGKLEQASSA